MTTSSRAQRATVFARQNLLAMKIFLGRLGGTTGITALWVLVNGVAVLGINRFASFITHSGSPAHHSYTDAHVQLHLGLVAVMIWVELRWGRMLLNKWVSPRFCRWFNNSRASWCAGPGAALLVVLVEIGAVAFGTCESSERCSTGLIAHLFGAKTIPIDEWYVMAAIISLAMAMRLYGWVAHYPPVETAAGFNQNDTASASS